MNPIKEKYGGRVLTTDEYANARNELEALTRDLENTSLETGQDYMLLKWGTLKGWELNSEKGKKLSDEYIALGRSMGAMTQEDNPRQKEIILEMIDECDGSIQSDWSGEYFTKQAAKEYLAPTSEAK